MTSGEPGVADTYEPTVASSERDRAGLPAGPRPPLGPTNSSPGSLASDPSGTAELTATGAGLPTTQTMELFQAFYQREFRSVVGLLYALSGSWLVAEDAAQEAFLAAYGDWQRVGRYDKPGAWVRRVAIRKQRRFARRGLCEAKALARSIFAADGDPVGVPELAAETVELWRAVRALPKRQAQVLTLYYQAGYGVADIAATLGCAEGTVKAQLHSGRRALAARLGTTPEFERVLP
jgi:RNA polymerase sigma-70 factor, ECF subfamily